jgi:hypothetical protein
MEKDTFCGKINKDLDKDFAVGVIGVAFVIHCQRCNGKSIQQNKQKKEIRNSLI